MNDYAFGNFLYMLRTEKGLSQSQLGGLLGVTNKAVSKWENGSAKPNTVLIPRIAEIFGVTVEELFACKRLEKDCEYKKIKNYLSSQRRKYAVISSVFLSDIRTTEIVPWFFVLPLSHRVKAFLRRYAMPSALITSIAAHSTGAESSPVSGSTGAADTFSTAVLLSTYAPLASLTRQ